MNVRSEKSKEQIFRDAFSLFVNGHIPDDIFNGYMSDTTGEGTLRLQYWILDSGNMKGWIVDWCTGIGIIEAVESLYQTSLMNGNLKK